MKSAAFLALALASVASSPSMAALLPECAAPAASVVSEADADETASEYLATMIRIELEGETLAMRVSRATADSLVESCKAKSGELVALGPQEPGPQELSPQE